jgi:hypothetical protein
MNQEIRMKRFKQFREEKKYNTLNSMLTDYVAGSIEDFDNKGNFAELFKPYDAEEEAGLGIPKLLHRFGVYIVKDGKPYTGTGDVVDYLKPMSFKLSNGQTLIVGLKKADDGDTIIASAKAI